MATLNIHRSFPNNTYLIIRTKTALEFRAIFVQHHGTKYNITEKLPRIFPIHLKLFTPRKLIKMNGNNSFDLF